MSGINKVIIIGHLGNDPDVRTMPNGEAVATLSIATSESWTDKQSGDKREQTEWHRIVLYRRQAEVAGQYLRKGSKAYIEGKLKTRKWQDQQGIERYTTEIHANALQLLDNRADSPPQQARTQPQKAPQSNQGQSGWDGYADNERPSNPSAAGNFDDDIPF